MHRFACLLVLLTLLVACDSGGDADAGVDAFRPPRRDAGPFVCPNPALDPHAPAPTGDQAPRPTELDVDRDATDGATALAFDPDAVPADAAFDLGVQAGAMRVTSALLWTHTTGAGDVALRVWREGGAAGEVLLAHESTLTPVDGYVHASVEGLAPATRYRYAFSVDDFTGRSPIGAFTTAIPDGTSARIRFAATTCTNQSQSPFEALTWLAGEDPDVFLQLGDMIYNDGAATTAGFREGWRAALTDPGYRAILPTTGAYYTWDDHEIIDSGDYYDIPASVREAGTDAWYETLPIEPIDRDGERTFWNAYPWGDAVEVIVLDSRSERDPATRRTPDARYVSEEQLAFLFDRLENGTAHFKVVLNSVPLTNLPIPPWGFEDDRWQGYEAQRDRLVAFLAERATGRVIFLTGDFHMGFVARVEVEGGARDVWEIAVGPGDSRSANPVPALVAGGVVPLQQGFPCEQFAYWNASQHAGTTIDLDPARDTVRVRFVDSETEEVLFDDLLTP